MSFTHSDMTIFLGPPGTGKTTSLLGVMEDELSAGVKPSKIGFVSFTRKAVGEARDRACSKFSFNKDQLPFFRTIHSMAFSNLGLRSTQVMQRDNYDELGRLLGVRIDGGMVSEDGIMSPGSATGDKMLFCDNLARNRRVSLSQQWKELAEDDVTWAMQEKFSRTLKKYKRERGIYDYTDMLEMFTGDGFMPTLDVLIVDESQDLSTLQWANVQQLARRSERVYIAGDDDQAIYRWAGADVDQFIQLQGKTRVLGQSYRLPQSVHRLSTSILRRIHTRREKQFQPRESPGSVHFHTGLDDVDMREGDWLILARNNYMLDTIEEYCRSAGYSYSSKKWNPTQSPVIQAIRLWEHVRKGGYVDGQSVKLIYRYMRVGGALKPGFKGLSGLNPETRVNMSTLMQSYGLQTDRIWHEVLEKIPREQRDYFVSTLRNGEKLTQEPRIRLSTIHGAKGGEATNVVLLTDISYRTHQEQLRNPDDEARVFYVGATRAKENLHIIEPSSNYHFEV